MGTHSAFFVPAKYGAMPEILPPHLLSKGNGLLESLSFLAVILGTVAGGVLSYFFKGQEYIIGIVLLALAVIGAAASFLIQKMPAANPTRPFPTNLFKPLVDNLRLLLRSRPLALAVLGIAFFTFMVAFMRGTMYMHGETRNPALERAANQHRRRRGGPGRRPGQPAGGVPFRRQNRAGSGAARRSGHDRRPGRLPP